MITMSTIWWTISQIAVGDTIVVDGKDMVVASREDKDGFVTINGGLEQGGVDLTSDDSGVYYAVGLDDANRIMSLAESLCRSPRALS